MQMETKAIDTTTTRESTSPYDT